MSDLRKFLERNRTVCDRLDRMLFSGSLLGQAVDEHVKTGRSIESVKKTLEPFFENIPTFEKWVSLQHKEQWEKQIIEIYEEQNQ